MPKAVERALKRASDKLAHSGKLRRKKGDTLSEAKNRFIYGTMSNMKKRGSV